MNEKLEKPYNPQDTESRIYETWETSGFFNPDICIEKGITDEKAEPFSMVLPPPNVTGTLHTGHALMLVIQDIMTRHARMQGKRTLWLPGTDHAAIATQSKVEKIIEKEEGKRKHDLGREEFLKRVEAFAQESHDTIVNQCRRMGASLDWSREAYTLDDTREVAVRTAFKQMYDDGLIYRGHRIVNWDPKGQTVISDDELIYKEEKTKFYYFKYGPFTIGTARPETKFGDKFIIMHPDDKRYSKYKNGEKLTVEWINGPIEATIIKDPVVDMEFGTGVMTITPWHSVVDFELAEKHNLSKEQVIDRYGKLLPIAGEFAGMKISEARDKIVEKMQLKGLVEKIEDYTHNIATAERTGATVEPQIMNQWFIDVNKPIKTRGNKSLKKLMLEAVKGGSIKIMPEQFEAVYFHWIENLRDWCISRQIWYGHRIPVWYRHLGTKTGGGIEEVGKVAETYCGIEAPAGDGWSQDEDTLDTWFSAGLWTFSTLGWPEKTTDLATYHPTTVLETGRDIIFFWVARMILMSEYLLGEAPFKTVYLHGLVRDEKGRKMSKSLGNIVDPLTLIDKYGTDALRMAMVVGVGPGSDSNLGEEKIKAYSKFANKLWNISRFILQSADPVFELDEKELLSQDTEYLKEFDDFIAEISREMDEYKFYIVAEKLYHYIWHTLADKIIEETKERMYNGDANAKRSASYTLHTILTKSLKALHPFMPFITEELWGIMPHTESLLMVEEWPHVR